MKVDEKTCTVALQGRSLGGGMVNRVVKSAVLGLVDRLQRVTLRGKTTPRAVSRALAWGYRYRPNPTTITVANGLRMAFADVDYIPLLLYYTGTFEAYGLHYARIVIGSASPNQAIIDVGGNIGFHSLQFAHYAGAEALILTVEASPEHVATINRNASFNHQAMARINVLNVAVGAEHGELTLSLPPGGNKGCYTAGGGTGEGAFTVRMVTLDSIAGEVGDRPISLIKMDIEGFEEQALRGGRAMIAKSRPPVMIELNAEVAEACGSSVENVISFFRDLDYVGLLMNASASGRPQIERLDGTKRKRVAEEVLFVPRERHGLIDMLLQN